MPEHKAAGWKTPIWDVYKQIANDSEGRTVPFEEVERFAFYERAKKVSVRASIAQRDMLIFYCESTLRFQIPNEDLRRYCVIRCRRTLSW